jgi:hypothetical protein
MPASIPWFGSAVAWSPWPGKDAMGEPTAQELLSARTALGPFVRRWGLPLNPEDIDELAYAVLRHVGSDHVLETIEAAVEAQINEHEANAQRLRDDMQAHLDRDQGQRGAGGA